MMPSSTGDPVMSSSGCQRTADQERKPVRAYKVTFLPANRTVQVDPAALPYGDDGLPGSILDIALGNGIVIDHACGGVCACATCHVLICGGIESCGDPADEEDDRLDNAYGLTPHSRLACVCVPDGTQDVVVEVPDWNRNRVREDR
jgi:ferredoxin, 2Fe-2S